MTVVEETNEELPNFTVSFVNDLIALRPAKATKSTNRVVSQSRVDVFTLKFILLCSKTIR